MGSTSPIRSAIDVSGVASFSPKRKSRCTHSIGRVVASLGDQVAGVAGHRPVRVVEDLRAGHEGDPLVEQAGEAADDAGLGLAPLAEEDHVVAGEQGVLQLGQDGVLVAEHPLDDGLARWRCGGPRCGAPPP